MKLNYKHYFLVGIGGIGMSGLAKILIKKGFKVSGSDIVKNSITKELEKSGANIYYKHDASNIIDSDVLIFSAAIGNNPEIIEAKKKKIPVFRRSELLGAILNEKKGIAVAGTHGKTTTSTLVSLILENGGYDPTIVVGGEVKNIGGNAKYGDGEFTVAEACEYEKSFLDLRPYASIITNIEEDHLDTYKNLEDILDTFKKFISQTDKAGFIVIPEDDMNVKKVIRNYEGEVITFGTTEGSNWRAKNIRINKLLTCFDLYKNSNKVGEISLKVPGMHNVQNALAAIALTTKLEVKFGDIKKTIEDFEGARRRFQIKGEKKGIIVIDDYAHHPTEVKTTLAGLRSIYPDKSKTVWCVFQPHQHSRTKLMLKDFASSFDEADEVIIPDIYAVAGREEDSKEINSKDLVDEINKNSKKARYVATFDEVVDYLKKNVKNNDIVITIGAGPVHKVGEKLLEKL